MLQKDMINRVIIDQFDLLVKPGDRIGIIGKNGTGKSTLLNILSGRIPLDSGELSHWSNCKNCLLYTGK